VQTVYEDKTMHIRYQTQAIAALATLFITHAYAAPSDFTDQTTCEEANYEWVDGACEFAPITGEGAALTMQLQNEQTLTVVTLTKQTADTDVTAGSYTYYGSDIPADFSPAAWGVKTNGRFSMSISNDFESIMNPGTSTAMFGTEPVIKDDFGTTVTWPAFVKWETDAAGKKYDGTEITGDKRYEVLPANFAIDLHNIDSISGSLDVYGQSSGTTGFKDTFWGGTGKEVIGFDAQSQNNFEDKVGVIQVADKLGASGTGGTASTVTYTWTDDNNQQQSAKISDHVVGVFVFPEMDGVAAANAQAGTYYAAIKLTVTAEEI